MPLTLIPQAALRRHRAGHRPPAAAPPTPWPAAPSLAEHQVLAFPARTCRSRIWNASRCISAFGTDPYFGSVPGHPHIAQVRRDADETTKIFAETWHSDWSFLRPPQATLFYGNVIPPVGGDTLFANQVAWDTLSPAMQALLQGRAFTRRGAVMRATACTASATRASMVMHFGDDALATQSHPIARVHPETASTALFVSPATPSASRAWQTPRRSRC